MPIIRWIRTHPMYGFNPFYSPSLHLRLVMQPAMREFVRIVRDA